MVVTKKWSGLSGYLIGGIFLGTAILKSLDPEAFATQIASFSIITDPGLVRFIAWGLIGIEAVLGTFLLLRLALSRLTLPLTAALLLFFSILLGWAWMFRDLQDCGCLGKYLSLTPAQALVKNMLLLSLTIHAWSGSVRARHGEAGTALGDSLLTRDLPAVHGRCWKTGCAVLCPLAVLIVTLVQAPQEWAAGASVRINDQARARTESDFNSLKNEFSHYSLTWNGNILNLAEGTYLVAMLSDSCSQCGGHVAELNALAHDPQMPQVVGLILGEEDTDRAFRDQYRPQFPTTALPVLEFLNLIGKAPPRFILVREGRQIQFWDEEFPQRELLLERLGS